MLVRYQNIELNVIENQQHDWLLDTQLVAKGYNVSPESIRSLKSRKKDELIEGKHFITVANCNGGDNQTMWTKRGVVRLGFSVRGTIAKKFRDWAEDLVISKSELVKPLSSLDILELSIKAIREQGKEIQDIRAEVRELKAATITRPDYFTIVGFATLNEIEVNLKYASALGRKAASICNQRGIQMDTIPDPRFGRVRMYPKQILAEVFLMPIK